MVKIIISYPSEINNELSLVNELLATDIDYFHIRKPDFDAIKLEEYINAINIEFRYKLILHSNYYLTLKYDLGGIHLNQKSLSALVLEEESDRCFIEPLMLRNSQIEINGQNVNSVSYSAHGFSEIESLQFNTDYIFLSPIFDSISKPNYFSNFKDKDQLKESILLSNKNIIALGGVENNKIDTVKEIGFYGYAILGSFWHSKIHELND